MMVRSDEHVLTLVFALDEAGMFVIFGQAMAEAGLILSAELPEVEFERSTREPRVSMH